MLTAVKYQMLKLCDDIFFLIPRGLVTGKLEDGYFSDDKQKYCHVRNPFLEGKFVVGNEMHDDDILDFFGAPKDELETAKRTYFEEKMEEMIIIRDGKMVSFRPSELYDDENVEKTVYEVVDGEDSVLLNEQIVNTLLAIDNLDDLKQLLGGFKDTIIRFSHQRQEQGVQRIRTRNGSIYDVDAVLGEYIQSEEGREALKKAQIEVKPTTAPSTKTAEKPSASNVPRAFEEISVEGLEKYLKERIFGHDEELEMISTILMSNFSATEEDGVESFLIPGPTGTGKTATMECAAEYLGVPIQVVNTINLVPQGYVGTTIEDELFSLISANGFRPELYNRCILVFDEFDKLGKDSLEEKITLTHIFLKLIEGGTFPINKQYKDYKVNTRMFNKVFLGAFTDAFSGKDKQMGFGTVREKKEAEKFSLQKLIDSGYFDRELLTRINYYFPYYELDDDTKLHVILDSRLSTFLKKKERFQREYGVTITGDEEFARGIIDALKKGDQSVRDLNNLISNALLKPQREIMMHRGEYKYLILNGDTVVNKTFELK